MQKQILLGDAATGKSSLLVRLTDDRFLQHSEPTVSSRLSTLSLACARVASIWQERSYVHCRATEFGFALIMGLDWMRVWSQSRHFTGRSWRRQWQESQVTNLGHGGSGKWQDEP